MSAREQGEQLSDWLERAWTERYLDRLLSPDESDWFEAYVLDKPHLLSLIEADSHLRDAVGGEGSHGENAALGTASQIVEIRGKSPLSIHWRWASAASLLLGVGIGFVVPRYEGASGVTDLARSKFTSDSVIADPTRVVFDTMRGTSSPPLVEHRNSHTAYILVEVAVPTNAEKVELELPNGHKSALKPSADGFASFLLARSAVVPGKLMVVRYLVDGKQQERDIALNEDQEGEGP